MTVSLPSKDIYIIDVPEVKKLNTEFRYNFFEKNERISASTGKSRNDFIVKSRLNSQQSDASEEEYNRLYRHIARYVNITYTPNIILNSSETNTKQLTATSKRHDLIKTNLSNIMSEEQFSTFYYVAIDFKDSAIYDKLQKQVSGTLAQMSKNTTQFTANEDNSYNSFKAVMSDTSQFVDSKFLQDSLKNFSKVGLVFENRKKNYASDKDMQKVTISTQINSKILHQLVDRTIKDPMTLCDDDMLDLHESSKVLQEKAIDDLKSHVIYADDFNTTANAIQSDKLSSLYAGRSNVEIVGYVIDKVELLTNGGVRTYPPIILENANTNVIQDMNVNYSSTYVYSVKTIALITLPSIIEDLKELASAKFLISSKPVVSTVKCVEDVVPPPVADLNFVWNYEDDSLLVIWSFPPNSQRDIKKFQVYRRSTINSAFELLKMYDFDDSEVKDTAGERIDEALIEHMSDPKTTYVDHTFEKNSKYIYAVTCVDAHGLSSNYSIQFEITFDIYNNRLVKKLISHSGAPKNYPNLYLQADTFVDVMKDFGHSRVNVYFTPECYKLRVKGEEGTVNVVKTTDDAAKYRLQMINLDIQKQQVIDISIENRSATVPITKFGSLKTRFKLR